MGRLSAGGIARVRFFSDGIQYVRVDRPAEFRDARQMPLFTVHNKALAFHKTQIIEAMEGTDLRTVEKKFSAALPSILPPSLHSSSPFSISSASFAPPPTTDWLTDYNLSRNTVGSSRMIALFNNLASANATSSSHDLIEIECKRDWFEFDRCVSFLCPSSVNILPALPSLHPARYFSVASSIYTPLFMPYPFILFVFHPSHPLCLLSSPLSDPSR